MILNRAKLLVLLRYLLHASPPAVWNPAFHPPGQRQELVVSLPPLCLLSPLLLRMVRVRLVLSLQAAPLYRLNHPLRVARLVVIVGALVFPGTVGRGAVTVSQERALSARHRTTVVAGGRIGIALLLRRALKVG